MEKFIMVFAFVFLNYIMPLVLSLPNEGVYLKLDVDNMPGDVHLLLDVDKGAETEKPENTITSTEFTPIQIPCPEEDGFFILPGTQKCFRLFDDSNRDWYQANAKCHDEGLIMAKISDEHALELRELLVKLFGDPGAYVWLDARFNGFQFEWDDGKLISNVDSLWYTGHPILKPDYCLVLLNSNGFMSSQPEMAYYAGTCLDTNARKALCEFPL